MEKAKKNRHTAHERSAPLPAEHSSEGGLGQIGLADPLGDDAGVEDAVAGIQSGDDDQRIEGEHHKGVDEHAHHGHHALIVGVLHVGLGVGVGGGAHARLVGEQAPLGALADGGLDGVAEAAADDRLGLGRRSGRSWRMSRGCSGTGR